MDRAIEPRVIRRRALRRAIWVALGLVALVLAWGWGSQLLRPSLRRSQVRTARVERGTVEATIEATGTVAPRLERALSSPLEARVTRILQQPGAHLFPGTEILELDTSGARLELERVDERLEQKSHELEQLEIEIEEELEDLHSRQESKTLDLEILRYKEGQSRKLRADGLISEEAYKQAEVAAKKARIEISQLERSRKSAQRRHRSRLASLELDLSLLRKEREATRRELELAQARSDVDGVLTWVVAEEGVTAGKGQVLARVADLSSFRVEASVSDLHASRLAPGLPVKVTLGETVLDGQIAAIDPTVVDGAVHFSVELDDASHPALRNQLRVDVHVITGRSSDVLTLPRGPFLTEAREQPVFVVRGDRAVRTSAQMGLAGRVSVEVLGGLSEGDEVIVSKMSDLSVFREIRLKD